MKMADMKMPKRTEKEMKGMAEAVKMEERDRWPYGLQLRFENEQIDKLPHLKNLTVGQKVTVQGVGEVTSLHMTERENNKENWTVEVQLHEVGCEGKKKDSSGSMSEDMRSINEKRRL